MSDWLTGLKKILREIGMVLPTSVSFHDITFTGFFPNVYQAARLDTELILIFSICVTAA